MLQEQRWVCPTALTVTAAGEASSIVFILPLFVCPALPLWPLVPHLTLLWEQKLWQENELGTDRSGRRISPGMLWQPVRRSGVLPVLSCGPVLPRAAASAWEPVPPSGKMWWVGRETGPFLFFPSVFLRKIYLWLLYWQETNCKFSVRASVKVVADYQRLNLCLFQVFVMMQTLLQKQIPAVWCYKVQIWNWCLMSSSFLKPPMPLESKMPREAFIP